jgi:hypothetical protein
VREYFQARVEHRYVRDAKPGNSELTTVVEQTVQHCFRVLNSEFPLLYTGDSSRDMAHHSEPVRSSQRNDPGGGRSIPAWVDWLIGGGIALVGLLLAGVGAVLTAVVDRAMITDAVTDFGTQSTFLTQAETVDVAVPTVTWTGIGLLVSGLVLFAGAVAYVSDDGL